MKKLSLFGCFVAICFVAGLSAPNSFGQAVYGSILGSVTDTQGSAVVGAKVVVTSVAKGSSEETTTNDSGNFTVSHLIPDIYNIHIEATGFKSYEVRGVQVSADTSANVDAKLDVGSVTDSVTVNGEAARLQTESAVVGQVVDNRYTTQIPLNGRDFSQLLLLVPGVTTRPGGFDLSVGSVAGFCAVVSAWLMKHAGFSVEAGLAAGLFFG